MDLILQCITKNYANFSGRARRKEYWLFYLAYIISFLIAIVFDTSMGLFDEVSGFGPIVAILYLASFVPSLSVGVRRLHDTDRRGWWYLIVFIPLIGFIVILVFFCLKGTEGSNRFGPDPLT